MAPLVLWSVDNTCTLYNYTHTSLKNGKGCSTYIYVLSYARTLQIGPTRRGEEYAGGHR